MKDSSKIGDLAWAVDLIAQPFLLRTLLAVDEGKAFRDAMPDAPADAVEVALRRLVSIGAAVDDGPTDFDRPRLTDRGRRLLLHVVDLDRAVADHDHVLGRSG
jgi:hypothetical protein